MTKQPDKEQPVYRATLASASLLVEEWEHTYSVYQRASGETHVFNDVTAAFLDCVCEAPGSLESVVARVALALGIAGDAVDTDDFRDVVARLEELGLIERTNPAGSVAA